MLAKVPVRRLDGGGSFADLVQYVMKDAAATTHSTEVWSLDDAPHEMEQVASYSRAKYPAYHYVLSWSETENPTDQEAFAAVKVTLTALGMHDHQWVAATHRNTDNLHAHVAVNRVNPETYKAVSTFRDWLTLDRTCRQIEVERGWMHDSGPFRVEAGQGGPQVVRTYREWSKDAPATPNARARNVAAWNGRDSFQEWLGKEPARCLKLALSRPDASWNDVHRVLADFNLEYRTKGSGAVIVDRTEPDTLHAKASHLCRFASRGQLEARLGPHREPTDAHSKKIAGSYRKDIEKRQIQVDDQIQERRALHERFKQTMAEWHDSRTRINEVAWQQQRETERSRRGQLRDENRDLRLWIESSAPKRDKKILRSLESIRAAVQRENLNAQIVKEREQLRAWICGPSPGSWRLWLAHEAGTGDTVAGRELRRLRRRERAGLQITVRSQEIGVASSAELPQRAFLSDLGWFADSAGVNYVRDGRTIFSDEGKRMVFRDLGDDHVRAGLALAREKWSGGLCLTGTESFQEKATMLSDQMGIKVLAGALRRLGPDLQELSRRYGKPIVECKIATGRRHTGKLVAMAADANRVGTAVVDVGRELLVLKTKTETANNPGSQVGSWVRVQASDIPGGPDKFALAWRIQEVDRHGHERSRSIGL